MIARLKGIVEDVERDRVIIDVNSVGYAVQISESDRARFPGIGSTVTLEIHTHVREDLLELFGFLNRLDREIFIFLMEASGVGPKLALTVLSHMNGEDLLRAIQREQVARLTSIPGIGKKKAERMILELRDKCEKRFADFFLGAKQSTGQDAASGAARDNVFAWEADLLAALQGLGYRENEVRSVLELVSKSSPANFQIALKSCLKFLSGNNPRKALHV